MNRPSLSILIPTYNCIDLLPALLDSLDGYMISSYEILFIDNHSTDGTYEYLNDRIHDIPAAKLYRQKINVGALNNFNSLFFLAQTDYVALFPVGDSRNKEYLDEMIMALEKFPNAGLCIPHIEVSLANRFKIYDVVLERNLIKGGLIARYRQSLLNLPGTAIYGVYRTKIVKQSLPIPIMRGGDICFLRRIYSTSDIIYCPDAHLYFSTRDNYNTVEQDTKFFFGDLGEDISKEKRFSYEVLNMLCEDYDWLMRKRLMHPSQSVLIRFVQLEFLFRKLLIKSVAQCFKFFIGRANYSIILKLFYLAFCKPSFIKNPNFPFFYFREILPQMGLNDTK